MLFPKSNLKIGNWPGTTFEKKEIVAKINNEEFHYIDMPGTYSVESLCETMKLLHLNILCHLKLI